MSLVLGPDLAGKNKKVGMVLKRSRQSSEVEALEAPGFTLMEVMVTLTILGFILVMIFGVFRLGFSAWEKGETNKEVYQKVRISSQMISRQIKSIVPYKIKTPKAEGNYLAFEGKARSLKFVSALPLRSRQPEGFVFAVYEFKKEGSEEGRLVLYEQKVLNKDFMEETPREESGISLLEGVVEARFEYYREEDKDENREAGWVAEWNAKEENKLPRALRITIIQKKGKGEKDETSFTILTELPSYRYEEMRRTPLRGVIPQRPLGTSG